MPLTANQVSQFWQNGYLFLPELLPTETILQLNNVIEELIKTSTLRNESDEDFDLYKGANGEELICNRIKETYRLHESFMGLLHSPSILDIISQLIGENIYFEDMPLNLKPPGRKSAIEWHQDWGYMPYTNDNVVIALIFLCDCDENNGAIRYISGSHRYAEITSHHHNDFFCGAIDPKDPSVCWENSKTIVGKAGGICLHHARTIHGSGLNNSKEIRPIQAIGYCAGDAWPLLSLDETTYSLLKKKLVKGSIQPPIMQNVPIRLPFPIAGKTGSLFKVQEAVYGRSFN
nr:phytanoyl-CoA dioxygenase family protein [uncultured Pedobacter sp.]